MENKKATEELLNEVAKEYATNGSYQEWLKLPTSPLSQEGDFAKTARCFKSGMREIISNPTKYGLTSATEVSEEQLQKEAEQYYQTRKGQIFSTPDEIRNAYIAGRRQSAVQDKKDTL